MKTLVMVVALAALVGLTGCQTMAGSEPLRCDQGCGE